MPPTESEPETAPGRRSFIGRVLTAGTVVWAAPTILSVPAAAAATVAPNITIDPFTIADSVLGISQTEREIAAIGAVTVTRRLRTSFPQSELIVGSGLATYSGLVGSVAIFDYLFGSPLDLSGCTSLTATATAADAVGFRLDIEFQDGNTIIVDPTTATPELRFDLSVFTPLQLATVTSISLWIGGSSTVSAQLGPLTAS